MTKVFIDGSAGTAGLRIRSRLEGRADLDVTVLEGEARKNTEKRREMLNSCDLAVLCLPDAASRETPTCVWWTPPRLTASPRAGPTASRS